MASVLITGMSGTGKSTVLGELARRGHRVVDTDYDDWCEEVPHADGTGSERLWREDRMAALLAAHVDGTLFVSGSVANQGRFYDRFDAVVLLSAPLEVVLERVRTRRTNDFGKTAEGACEAHPSVPPPFVTLPGWSFSARSRGRAASRRLRGQDASPDGWGGALIESPSCRILARLSSTPNAATIRSPSSRKT